MLDVEMLVVGAGPAGRFFAAEMHRRGHPCLLIERAAAASTHSKALALMPGTMDLFEQSGVAQAFVSAANRIDGVRFVTPRASVFVPFARMRSRYNYISILPQWKTEELLGVHLQAYGGRIAYGHELVALEQCADGCRATIRGPQGQYTVRARYVIGCDGIHSTVRQQMKIPFEGDTYPGAALLADAHVRTDVPVNEAQVHVDGHGAVTMFPIDTHVRRVVVIAPRERLPDRASREWLQDRLRAAGYGGVLIEEPGASNVFQVHRRIASAMRDGNVFLAGDSVHTHSPVGGQGMNIGLHDAWNLASKLARVLDGDAPEALLDGYEHERLPVAKGVLRRTDVLTRALAHPNPLLRITRERIVPRIARLPVVYEPVLRRLSLTA